MDRKLFSISLLALLSAVAHGQYNVWIDRGERITKDQTISRVGSTIENPYGSGKLLFVYPTYKELPLARIITQVEDGVPLLFGDPAWPSKYTPLGSPSPVAKGGYIEADPAGDNLVPGEKSVSGINVRVEESKYSWKNEAYYAYGSVARFRNWETKISAFHSIRPIPQ